MREILFRAKDPNGNWVYGGITSPMHEKDGKIRIVTIASNGDEDISCFIEVDEDTVCQFTGLTDKNGNKIFEGDIVQWTDSDGNNRIDFVKWVHGGLVLCNAQYTVGSYLNNDLLVIGNVFDNTELK